MCDNKWIETRAYTNYGVVFRKAVDPHHTQYTVVSREDGYDKWTLWGFLKINHLTKKEEGMEFNDKESAITYAELIE